MYRLKTFLASAFLFWASEPVSASASTGSSLVERGLSNRLINGQAANIKDFPFMATMYIKSPYVEGLFGSALIAPNIVVTPAHAFIDYNRTYSNAYGDSNSTDFDYSPGEGLEIILIDYSQISVNFGDTSANHTDSSGYKISKVITSPNNFWAISLKLLALIVLDKDVPSSVAIPAEIYNQNVTDGTALQLAGFGSTSKIDNMTYSKTLNYLDVTISSTDICTRQGMFFNNTGSYLCSTIVESKGGCFGDFGGPLTTAGAGARKLVGLLSGVLINFNLPNDSSLNRTEIPPYQCAKDGDIMIYLNLQYFSSWIEEQNKALNSSSSTSSSTSKSSSSPGRLAPYRNSQVSFTAALAGMVLVCVLLGTL